MIDEINDPVVHAEVTAVFNRYEAALVSNDVDVLDELFMKSQFTLRYGATENLYGYDAIQQFRAGRDPKGLERKLVELVITTYGQDFATANAEFIRDEIRRAVPLALGGKARPGCAPPRDGGLSRRTSVTSTARRHVRWHLRTVNIFWCKQ